MKFPPVRDYSPLLQQAIAEAKAAGMKVWLNETEMVWVGWRQLLAWFRRPETLA